jgi:hypothetical protein
LTALPDIFHGTGVEPLEPGNTSLLLWLIMGYLVDRHVGGQLRSAVRRPSTAAHRPELATRNRPPAESGRSPCGIGA